MESYSKAERLTQPLIPNDSTGRARRLLVDVLIAQAEVAWYSNQREIASAKALGALALARERARSAPMNEDAQFQLGNALQCAGSYSGTKDKIPYLVEEASVFEGMLVHNPNNPSWQRDAALAHKYVAGNLITIGDLDSAFAHLKRAQELDESVLRAAPNDPGNKMDLAIDLSQWAEYYQGKKNIAKGIEYTRASLAIRRELAAADPKDTWAKDKLSYILTQLGDLQLNVSALDALASYKEARSIAEQLQTQSLRADRLAISTSGMGKAYRRLGEVQRSCAAYAESMKLYREVLKSSPDDASLAQATERAYSRCPDANR